MYIFFYNNIAKALTYQSQYHYLSFFCDQSEDDCVWSKHAANLRNKYSISSGFDWIYSVSLENILPASDAICSQILTKLSPTHRPHSPSPHITTHYLYVLYGLQNRHSPWERTDSPGHIARKLTFHPTTPPAAPRDPCSSPDNIRLPDIIYVYTLSDARDLDIIVFWFFLCILYSTSLSSYVQPDGGHHYGRNM